MKSSAALQLSRLGTLFGNAISSFLYYYCPLRHFIVTTLLRQFFSLAQLNARFKSPCPSPPSPPEYHPQSDRFRIQLRCSIAIFSHPLRLCSTPLDCFCLVDPNQAPSSSHPTSLSAQSFHLPLFSLAYHAMPLAFFLPYTKPLLSFPSHINPLLTPKRPPNSTPVLATSSLKPNFLIAAASAITLTLSNFSPTPSSALATSPTLHHHHPPSVLVFSSHPTSYTHSRPVATTVAVVGVANAPIHDYSAQTAQQPPYQSSTEQRDAADDARWEILLASRLITAVLLAVMVGIERRATALNLGVRSITLLTLSTAMCFVVATSPSASTSTIAACIGAAPAMFVVMAGLASALGLYVVAVSRKRRPAETVAMSTLVGVVVTMGGACGAGLSLMSAGCYLAAVAVMRGRGRKVETQDVKERELRVHSRAAWSGDNVVALRIGRPDQRGTTRVVHMGNTVLRPPEHDGLGAEDSM